MDWYSVEYPTSHLYFLVYTRDFRRVCIPSDEWDITLLYHEKGLHNYLIPCHRKFSGQMGRLGVVQLNCTDRLKGSVEYWRMYNGFPEFWLVVFSMAWYKTLDFCLCLQCHHSEQIHCRTLNFFISRQMPFRNCLAFSWQHLKRLYFFHSQLNPVTYSEIFNIMQTTFSI